MPETVAIIIPCYHSEGFIRQCAQSLIDQTFKDWKAYFIIDDYKYDHTIAILKSLNEPRFDITASEGKSTCAAARNLGYRISDGKYVAFLDSDDWWEPEKLEKQVVYMESHPGISWSAHYFIEHRGAAEYKHETIPGEFPVIGSVATILFRWDCLNSVIGKWHELFNEKMDRVDDGDLVLRILEENRLVIPEYLSHYRWTKGSLTGQTSAIKESWIITKMCFNRKSWKYFWYYLKNTTGVILYEIKCIP